MPRKYCKICGKPDYKWLKEHSKDVYSKYCSEECKKKDEITIMKDELNLMVNQLNIFYYHINRNNIKTTLTYSEDFIFEFELIKKKYGYPYDKKLID